MGYPRRDDRVVRESSVQSRTTKTLLTFLCGEAVRALGVPPVHDSAQRGGFGGSTAPNGRNIDEM